MTDAADRGSSARANNLRRRLATVLVAVTLGSVLLLGIVNYLEARVLLTTEVTSALGAHGTAIARQIDSGLETIKGVAAVVAEGPRLAGDLEAFSAALHAPGTDAVSNAERMELTAYYQSSVIPAIENAGLSAPAVEELLPDTDAGVSLQLRYLAGGAADEVDPSMRAYVDAYEERNAFLTQLTDTLGFARMLLIDSDGLIVYSTAPQPDLGTSLSAGPYRETELAEVVDQRLATTPTGDAVFSDFEFYLPNGGRPTMFAVVALRAGGEFTGAVAFEIPIDALNSLTTADGRWELIGLGRTGEVYIVGPDGLMRSESRRWIEDPDAYLSDLETTPAADVGDLIATLDTTVLIQPVDSPVVLDALDGLTTSGRTIDYLGRPSLTFAVPIDSEGLGWVAVAEISDAEASASLHSFRNRLLILAAVILPIAGLLGMVIADRITRPIRPVVDAARSIAGGDLETAIPDLGSNEFGDVARRLDDMAAHLRTQEDELAVEEQEITRMLLAALPPRLVERLRSGDRRIEDLIDTATVISVTVTGVFDRAGIDPDVAVELGMRISGALEDLAQQQGIERVRSSTAHHLFVGGLDAPDPQAEAAVAFTLAARDAVMAEGDSEGVDVGFHAGLAAGRVVSGLLTGTQLAYGVFGEAVQLALTLDASARSGGEIVVDVSVADLLGDRWIVEPASDLVDLGGFDITGFRVVGRTAGADTSTSVAPTEAAPGG